jgi:hypothetical protein
VTTAAGLLLPLSRLGFVVAAVTGLLMFAPGRVSSPTVAAPRWKLGLIVLAGLNILLFHKGTYRACSTGTMTESRPSPPVQHRSCP